MSTQKTESVNHAFGMTNPKGSLTFSRNAAARDHSSQNSHTRNCDTDGLHCIVEILSSSWCVQCKPTCVHSSLCVNGTQEPTHSSGHNLLPSPWSFSNTQSTTDSVWTAAVWTFYAIWPKSCCTTTQFQPPFSQRMNFDVLIG